MNHDRILKHWLGLMSTNILEEEIRGYLFQIEYTMDGLGEHAAIDTYKASFFNSDDQECAAPEWCDDKFLDQLIYNHYYDSLEPELMGLSK